MGIQEFLESKGALFHMDEKGMAKLYPLIEEWRTMPSGKIQPLYDKVMVELIEGDLMVGNIHLPQSSQEKPIRGLVIAVGPGKDGEPMSTKVGDIVLFGKHAGTEVDIDNKTYKLMREIEIFAIV